MEIKMNMKMPECNLPTEFYSKERDYNWKSIQSRDERMRLSDGREYSISELELVCTYNYTFDPETESRKVAFDKVKRIGRKSKKVLVKLGDPPAGFIGLADSLPSARTCEYRLYICKSHPQLQTKWDLII